MWYYKDTVRSSILRYKFYNRRSYVNTYGRFLAMKLQKNGWDAPEILTYVSTGWLRRLGRGYDHAALLAQAVGKELGIPSVRTLQKTRHTPPQSGLVRAAERRANILGAYRVIDPAFVKGKRVLLIDDIITTGATASECGRVLLTAGAKEVYCAAIAAAPHDTKENCR